MLAAAARMLAAAARKANEAFGRILHL